MGRGGPAPRPGPLLVTAELPGDVFAWADALRREHYPPERNRIPAHVTLFHGLPPSAEPEIRATLATLAASHPPAPARLAGIMSLGTGTALKIDSPALQAIHQELSERFHGLLSAQDSHRLALHVTVQNKVSTRAARALQAELGAMLEERRFAFTGLQLQRYREGAWEFVRRWPFRGAKRA